VWDAATGKPHAVPMMHQDNVKSAAFSPDGTRVVTASEDRTARVWDAVAGKPLTSPLKHQAEVVSAAFSPDGTRVVTASFDKTAQVWDVGLDEKPLEQWSAVIERGPSFFRQHARAPVCPGGDKVQRELRKCCVTATRSPIWQPAPSAATLTACASTTRRPTFAIAAAFPLRDLRD
jgi:dipeptidyl aminopeptidase/acylaminoacyl peptidase